jgi:Ca2+-binding RTX toxin-like protein
MANFTSFPTASSFAPWQTTVDFTNPLGVVNIRGFGAVEAFGCSDGTFVLLHLQSALVTDIVHSQSMAIFQTASWIEATLTPAGVSQGGPMIFLADLSTYLAQPGATSAGAAALLMQGNDSFIGTTGNETFLGGGGINTVDYGAAVSAVQANLLTGLATGQGIDHFGNIQNLVGSAFADKLTGDAGDNLLSGGAGNDTLLGGAGSDTLVGGAGVDQLYGGAGADAFRFNSLADAGDRVRDFAHASDWLEFSALGFGGGLVAGMDMTEYFVDGAKANQAHGQFLYNHNSGGLFWDADGTGAGTKVLVTTLVGAPEVTATDLHVIG